MKFKKIIIFFLILFWLLSMCVSTNAEETLVDNSYINSLENSEDSQSVDINFSSISDNFNNCTYTTNLKKLGITLTAIQKDNTIILTYNNTDTVIFTLDPESNLLSTYYPLSDNHAKDVLTAILVDTISTMQGNDVGDQLPFYFDDGFCYSYYLTDGISKDYISSDLGASISCQIKIDTKMSVPSDISPIDESTFTLDVDNLYSKNEYFTRKNGLIFYKKYSDDGKMEIYIGQSKGFDEYSYQSVLNFLSLIYDNINFNTPKVLLYMKQNYTGLDKGNAEFGGVKIDTDLTEFPITTEETVLVGNNMKYAKFTIDENLLKEYSAKVSLIASTNNHLTNSYKIKFAIGLLGVLSLLIIIKLTRKIKK